MTQSVDTVLPGNTILAGTHSIRERARAWCLTIFNDELQYPEKARYNLICSDTTKDGKPHFHQYLYFNNAIAFSTIKKLYPTAHIQREIEPQAYISYIKDNKNGRKTIIFEEGNVPAKNKFPTIAEAKKMSIEEREQLPLHYKNIIDKINDEQANDIDIEDWHKEIKVYWIYGPSGIGKTEKAKQIVRDNAATYGKTVNIVKHTDTFWSGIGNAKIAIYDDFRDSHMPPSEFINFIDYNMHTLNIKGGQKQNNYSLIIITSVQHPQCIYCNMRDSEPRKQWMRRIELIDMTAEDDIDISDW